MERVIPFEVGEYYHVYNRGVDKAEIFRDEHDWRRFMSLLYVYNSKKSFAYRGVREQPLDFNRGEPIVDIIAYSLMPNHFHLLVREREKGGISKFMAKILTSFSMYMNEKYARSGPLMCRPFRSKHIGTDEYFRWVFAYIHLNPIQSKGSTHSRGELRALLREYTYGSYHDYFVGKRKASVILTQEALPFPVSEIGSESSLIDCLHEADAEEYFMESEIFLHQSDIAHEILNT